MRHRGRAGEEAEEIPLAPMIDMVFLLLVFFMCVSSLNSSQQAVEVDLADSSTADPDRGEGGLGTVTIDPDGRIHCGSAPVTLDELGPWVRRWVEETPHLRVRVRADRRTPFSRIQPVLRVCAENGAMDVHYAAWQTSP